MNRALMLLMAALLAQASAQEGATGLPPALPADTLPADASPVAVDEAAPVEAAPADALPVASRESTLMLPFDAPEEAAEIVIAQDLPDGATYVPGSALVNGQAAPEPKVGAKGRLYWTLPTVRRGALSFRVSHEGALADLPSPALLALFRGERREALVGRIDLADLSDAKPLRLGAAENDGGIRLPLEGTVVRDRDQVTVTVVGPIDGEPELTVNGTSVPFRLVGSRTTDPGAGTVRSEYYGVPLRAGENVLEYGGETVRVFLAGPAASVVAQPLQLLADGSSRVRVKLRVLDANGVPASEDTVTLRSNLALLGADAEPNRGGYQLRLTNGEGILELAPLSAPVRWNVDALLGDSVTGFSFDVTPDTASVGVGQASVTIGASPFGIAAYSASAYYEGMIGAGKLYGALNSAGLPTSSNPNGRFSIFGDASSESLPLQGIDPIAFRYEHPDFSVQYRQAPVPISVFSVGENLTALSASTRGDVHVSGFAAAVPTDRVSEVLIPDGTRLLRLSRGNIVPDSETIDLVVRESGSGKELRRLTLRRFEDYTLDPTTGTLEFPRALLRVDEALNDLSLEARYRLLDGNANRALAYGAEVGYANANVAAAAAVVSLDGRVTTGAKVVYKDEERSASAAVAYAGAFQVSADAAADLGPVDASVGLRYQGAGYNGLNAFATGWSATAALKPELAAPFSAGLAASYHDNFVTSGGNVTATGRYDFQPFSVGLGLRAGFGDEAGVTALANLGLRLAPFDVDLGHSQVLGGDATTQMGVGVALSPTTKLTARNELGWRTGNRASLGATTRLGDVNLSANYELPTADGAGNRARFGADTSFALTPTLNFGVTGAYLYDMRASVGEISGGTSLRYGTTGLTASVAADVALRGDQFKAVLRGGVTGTVTPHLTLSADALSEFSATPGTRASASFAYRDSALSGLGYLRYQNGSLAADGAQVSGELSAEYRRAAFAVRGTVAGRELLADPDSLTFQPGVGATAYVTDWLGIGVGARALFQPATGTTLVGYGIEGSVRVLPGAWATVGYNPTGFQGLPGTSTKPGLYFRLDLTLDEGGRK